MATKQVKYNSLQDLNVLKQQLKDKEIKNEKTADLVFKTPPLKNSKRLEILDENLINYSVIKEGDYDGVKFNMNMHDEIGHVNEKRNAPTNT